jgi:hypothetical protein
MHKKQHGCWIWIVLWFHTNYQEWSIDGFKQLKKKQQIMEIKKKLVQIIKWLLFSSLNVFFF